MQDDTNKPVDPMMAPAPVDPPMATPAPVVEEPVATPTPEPLAPEQPVVPVMPADGTGMPPTGAPPAAV